MNIVGCFEVIHTLESYLLAGKTNLSYRGGFTKKILGDKLTLRKANY